MNEALRQRADRYFQILLVKAFRLPVKPVPVHPADGVKDFQVFWGDLAEPTALGDRARLQDRREVLGGIDLLKPCPQCGKQILALPQAALPAITLNQSQLRRLQMHKQASHPTMAEQVGVRHHELVLADV
jgi:hypothetical protein